MSSLALCSPSNWSLKWEHRISSRWFLWSVLLQASAQAERYNALSCEENPTFWLKFQAGADLPTIPVGFGSSCGVYFTHLQPKGSHFCLLHHMQSFFWYNDIPQFFGLTHRWGFPINCHIKTLSSIVSLNYSISCYIMFISLSLHTFHPQLAWLTSFTFPSSCGVCFTNLKCCFTAIFGTSAVLRRTQPSRKRWQFSRSAASQSASRWLPGPATSTRRSLAIWLTSQVEVQSR